MSSIRSIRRQMIREAAQDLAQLGRLACPKCKASLQRKGAMSKKVLCPNCGWKGRTK